MNMKTPEKKNNKTNESKLKVNSNINVRHLIKRMKNRNLQRMNTEIHTEEKVNPTIHLCYTTKHYEPQCGRHTVSYVTQT